MSRWCRVGMHLPGPRKVFHRGHLFTRCAECEATLMGTGENWYPVPAGKRVIWRERSADDQFFAETKNNQRHRLRFHPIAALRRHLLHPAG